MNELHKNNNFNLENYFPESFVPTKLVELLGSNSIICVCAPVIIIPLLHRDSGLCLTFEF